MTRKKKVPVVKLAERDEAAVLAGLPAAATVALDDIAGAIREGLLAFSCSAGLLVVQQLMAEEMTAKVGLRGRHDPERPATRDKYLTDHGQRACGDLLAELDDDITIVVTPTRWLGWDMTGLLENLAARGADLDQVETWFRSDE
jgi:hypothetical protein